jgi:hypothetical protein
MVYLVRHFKRLRIFEDVYHDQKPTLIAFFLILLIFAIFFVNLILYPLDWKAESTTHR